MCPMKPLRPCSYPGCNQLVTSGRCEKHTTQTQRQYDKQRGTPTERGYNSRWYRYSKLFLSRPENTFCKLQLPGCTNIAKCVDHIQAPNGADDPLFWQTSNHQASCIHCNSVKGHKTMVGNAEPFSNITKG